MDEALRRAGWIVVAVVLGSYVTFLVSGNVFGSHSASLNIPIVIRDHVRPGEHHLKGMLLVANTCDQLSVSSKQVAEFEYELTFETWPDPAVPCEHEPSPRVFEAVVFAPSIGVRFVATLDKEPLEIAVYPTLTNQ